MAIPRTFLDWSQPALPQAADWLIREGRMMSHVDLSNMIVVVPGKRAGRRLLELLIERTQQHGGRFSRPTVTTVGQLPELLYEPKFPFASELVQRLAWTHALRQSDRRELARVIPKLPDDKDDARWLELGELLSKQHRELAADGLNFADVSEKGVRRESRRWSVLRAVQESYLRLLDDLALWDLQTARLFAVEHREFAAESSLRASANIVLLGTVDMNIATRQVLEQIADRVSVLIHAPESEKGGFDKLGCLRTDKWTQRAIPIRDEQLLLADDPDDQAAVVAGCLGRFNGKYRADEITIGVCDEHVVRNLQGHLNHLNVPTRWLVAREITEALPCRFLSALADYLDDEKFSRFATLVRHADVESWLIRKEVSPNWLTELDRYFDRHLPSQMGEWLGLEEKHQQIRAVHTLVEQTTRVLRRGKQSPADWSPLILRVILELYDGVEFDRDVPEEAATVSALQHVHKVLLDLTRIPHEVTLSLTASETIRLVLDQLSGESLISEPDDAAIELLGWLELPLDDAPAAIVTSFNDGFVPRSITSDLFLPNELRRKLELVDSARYFARDAYALSAVLASRDDVRFLVPRRGLEDQPQLPSRLLFTSGGRETAERCIAFFGEEPESAPAPRITVASQASGPGDFKVPEPSIGEPVTSVSVTAFRTYLECPYRFYLRHVLKRERLDDSSLELNPLQFGNLAHSVLDWFGKSELKSSVDADQIRRALESRLDWIARQDYGQQRMAAIEIQLLQLRRRLAAFARWQAERAGKGWVIQHVEAEQRVPVKLQTDDGREIELRGRIDRIDHHPEKNEWEIFDYKTSETERNPKQAHQKRTKDGRYEWVDLQLPLYRHLAKPLGVSVATLGYIVLPKNRDTVRALYADWSPTELSDADTEARRVARRILNKEFLPVASLKRESDDFGAICQANVFEKQLPPTPAYAADPIDNDEDW
jgi:ATP-dependent helicase/nuclease subunit B